MTTVDVVIGSVIIDTTIINIKEIAHGGTPSENCKFCPNQPASPDC